MRRNDRRCAAGQRWLLTRSQALLLVALLLVGTKVIEMLSLNNWPAFKKSADLCAPPAGLHARLYQLTDKVSRVFDRLQVVHWLHYGSLLGALRYHAILPWDDDVDLAVLGSSLGRLSLDDLQREFAAEHVRVGYSHWGGYFVFQLDDDDDDDGQPVARLDAMIYEQDGDYWMNRVGIERYVFWLNYRHWHRFPRRLVWPLPLARRRFGPTAVYVPHGVNAMLPYLFPENWWTEQKPRSCFIDAAAWRSSLHLNKKDI